VSERVALRFVEEESARVVTASFAEIDRNAWAGEEVAQ